MTVATAPPIPAQFVIEAHRGEVWLPVAVCGTWPAAFVERASPGEFLVRDQGEVKLEVIGDKCSARGPAACVRDAISTSVAFGMR